MERRREAESGEGGHGLGRELTEQNREGARRKGQGHAIYTATRPKAKPGPAPTVVCTPRDLDKEGKQLRPCDTIHSLHSPCELCA